MVLRLDALTELHWDSGLGKCVLACCQPLDTESCSILCVCIPWNFHIWCNQAPAGVASSMFPDKGLLPESFTVPGTNPGSFRLGSRHIIEVASGAKGIRISLRISSFAEIQRIIKAHYKITYKQTKVQSAFQLHPWIVIQSCDGNHKTSPSRGSTSRN